MSRENAVKVLKEVQNARETLEHNILEVCRKHEQLDLFTYFDERPRYGEEENVIRIKKQVSDKIKEISNEIQTEIYTKKTCNNKGEKGYVDSRKRGRFPLTHINKKSTVIPQTPTNTNSKLPIKPPKQKVKKGKIKEPKKSDPPPKSSTAYDELILQHIYGRQPHQPHRHTYRNEKPRFCSPHSYNVSKTVQSPTVRTEIKQVPKDFKIQPKNEYCIHLQPHDIPFSIAHNFPTATKLVEPSRCLSDRLPLSTIPDELTETKSPNIVPKKRQLSKAGPNVAVINIKADDMAENSAIRNRIRSKVRDRLKNRMKLNVQPLPSVDIDTTDSSTSTMSYNTQMSSNDTAHTIEKTANASEINENRYDFQDFISVQDFPNKSTNDTEDEVQPDESFKQSQISLSGCKVPHEQDYHGPAFPPQHFQKVHDVIDTVTVKMSPTLEQSAQDWLEKELLARLITQMMDQQNQLPIKEFANNVSVVSVEPDESKSSHDWIDNIIGLKGIQLFIDAGLPVNKDLITEVIRTVILECLETMFGHPQPERVLEPPLVESYIETNIPTPLSTPITTPCASEKKENAATPDQTISDMTEQDINDIVTELVSVHEENCDDLHYEIVQTPNISILENDDKDILNNNIVTPDITLIEDSEPSVCNDFQTPGNSYKTIELTQIPLSDFEITEKIMSPVSVCDDKKLTNAELEITPPVVVVKALPVTTSPSIPSTTFTNSSSTAIGLSTFDEISMGEYLNSASGVSDASEGEVGLPGRMKSWKLIEDSIEVVDDSFTSKPGNQRYLFPSKQHRSFEKRSHKNNDILSDGEISQTFWRPLKSIGEASDIVRSDESNIDTEDLDDDTDELSIAKALDHEDDPMIKLLNKINSPVGGHISYPGHSHKSEGEVIPQHTKYAVEQIPSLSSGENISNVSLTLGMLNQGNDVVSTIQDDSNLTPVSVTKGRVINVKSVPRNENKNNEFKEISRSDGEILNIENSQIGEISKSEGEFFNFDLDMQEVLNRDLDSVESFKEEDENEKVVMVLRLPELEDYQNVTDDDLSPDDISTISEF